MTLRHQIATLAAGLALLLAAPAAVAQVAIIAHPSVKAAGVSTTELSEIYMDQTDRLSDGSRVEPVDQAEGSDIRAKFYRDALDRSERQMKAYWSKRMFTGKGRPPRALPNDEAVLEFVGSTPGAIGYIDGGRVNDSVKILLILP
jgi:ABC-type phosphate transport system substrate-binding protein